MARIVLATFGSLGDLNPFLGLGLGLAARGHAVTVATHACYRNRIPPELGFHPVRPDLPQDAAFHTRFMDPRRGGQFAHRSFLAPAIEHSYADLLAAVIGADLLVSQTLMLAAPLVAATAKLKWLSAMFQPFTLYSAYDPPCTPGLPLVSAPRHPWQVALNRRLLGYAGRFTKRWVTPVLALRDRLGIADYGQPIFGGQQSPAGSLAMFPPLFATPQPDWPARAVQTGAVAYQDGPAAQLPDAVSAFLQAGAAPLLFTLGASASRGRSRFYETAVAIARRLRQRALLVGDPAAGPLPPGLMRCGALPYATIFPHAAAVIQPGGIGTAILALQAGKPQLLVPFAHDQTDNARRLERAGVAAVIPIGRFTAARGAKALAGLLDDPALPERLAAAVPEDGTAMAVAAVEQALAA